MGMERGLMPDGKDRQAPVEYAVPAAPTQVPLVYPPDQHLTIMPPELSGVQQRLPPPQESEMARTFTVTDDFWSDELQSQYVAGMSYTARDADDKLLGMIDKWIKEGKVREGGPEAVVSGTAEVQDADDDK